MISSAANDDASGNDDRAEAHATTDAANTADAPGDGTMIEDGGSRMEDGGQGLDAESQTAIAPATDHRFLNVPDLIPARMLNEFAYCPRLAYLEWAQGEFVHNLETLEGRFGHRRVDEPSRGEVPGASRVSKGEPLGGHRFEENWSLRVLSPEIEDGGSKVEDGLEIDADLQAERPPLPPLPKGGNDDGEPISHASRLAPHASPLPKGGNDDVRLESLTYGGEPMHARSLMLSAPGEGLICKIDVLELEGDVATPIDYKRGKQPDVPEGAYEPERVQVCAQGLILREAGYRSDEGVLYFIESKRRVPVVFDEDLVARTRELIAGLRRMGEDQAMPPPLVDSPKCPRCSLVGICLPDETNLLRGEFVGQVSNLSETDDGEPCAGHRFEENWSPRVCPPGIDASKMEDGGSRMEDSDVEFEAHGIVERPVDADDRQVRNLPHDVESQLTRPPLPPLPKGGNHDGVPVNRVRRLLPARDDAHPLYVQEQGAMLGKSGDRLTVTVRDKGKGKPKPIQTVRLIDVSQVSLYGNVQVSEQALRELAARGVPICHLSYGGWLSAITTGLVHKNVELRIRQFAVAADPRASLALARQFVVGKIKNCRTLLRRHLPRDLPDNSPGGHTLVLGQLAELAEQAGRASCVETLLGTEGMAAKLYFAGFAKLLKGGETFDIEGRNRRPPKDPTNALLSFVYSMLARELTVVLQAVGFDPLLGVFHRPRYGRPSLALDLAEEFRPLIADSTVLMLVNNGEVSAESFIRRGGAVALTTAGRRAVIEAFERRLESEVTHPLFGYRVSYRRILEVQARLLSRVLLGDLPEYPNFCTR